MWLILAILSSVFAALTSILAKIGIDERLFSITSPSTKAPIPVNPAITIFPTSINSMPIGLPLFAWAEYNLYHKSANKKRIKERTKFFS